MRSKGVKSEIEKELLKGVTREILNTKFNKGTVTQVYNKLNNEGLLSKSEVVSINVNNKEESIEKQVLNLVTNIIDIISDTGEYIINISVNKKVVDKDKHKYIVLNPFKLYGDVGKEAMIKELLKYDAKYLKEVLKKHFTYDKNEIKKINSIEELINIIILNIERTVKIGDSFRQK